MDDNQIVDLFLSRDQSAIKETSQKYGPKLRALAHNLLGSASDAEECENDAYLQAWNAIPPHEPRNYLFPFLAKLTRRLAIDVCRSHTRQKRRAPITQLSAELEQCIPSHGSHADTQGAIDGIFLSEAVSSYLYTIAEEPRNIFIRRYWYLEPVGKIAERFGISRPKVKTTLYRTRNGLREYLIKEGYTL